MLKPYIWQMVVVDAGGEVNVGADIGKQRRTDADFGRFAFSTHFASRYKY